MASKRDLKKRVNYICGELLAECVACSLYGAKKDSNEAKAIMQSIIGIHRDYICRISHIEPGMNAKDFFKNYSTTFNEQVEEAIDQISNL